MPLEFVDVRVVSGRAYWRSMARKVRCPVCRALVGKPCITEGGWSRKDEHPQRLVLAKRRGFV